MPTFSKAARPIAATLNKLDERIRRPLAAKEHQKSRNIVSRAEPAWRRSKAALAISDAAACVAVFAHFAAGCDVRLMLQTFTPRRRSTRIAPTAISLAKSLAPRAGRDIILQSAAFEVLEHRRLMSATFESGTLTIQGTDGDDAVLFGQEGEKLIVADNDETHEFTYADVKRIVVDAGAGDDYVEAGSSVDIALVVDGGTGNDEIIGGTGNDMLAGGAGDDVITGLAGDDTLHGNDGDDLLSGVAGDDWIEGHAGADSILGGNGDDRLNSGDGDDLVRGGAGNDRVEGEEGDDLLLGESGNDILDGNTGDDRLFGHDGFDAIDGGLGDDGLDGGGRSVLLGAGGADTFVKDNDAVYADFDPSVDTFAGSIDDSGSRGGSNSDDDRDDDDRGVGNDSGSGDDESGDDSGRSDDDDDTGRGDTGNDDDDNGNDDGSGDEKDDSGAFDKSGKGERIVPGNGFTGQTTEPGAYGSGLYADAKAIARWDVVPSQHFDGKFEVGVIAFHAAGIDRVEFSVNGGQSVAVTEMRLNPRTGVEEYYAVLDAADFAGGETRAEVRAIAFPTKGQPRLLESMVLYANPDGVEAPVIYVKPSAGNDGANGSLNSPLRSLEAALVKVPDGGRIVLMEAGEYMVDEWEARRNNTQWVTVEGAAHLDTRDIVLKSSSPTKPLRPGLDMLRWHNVSFDFAKLKMYYNEPDDQVWFDGVEWYDSIGWTHVFKGQQTPVRKDEGPEMATYVTNSHVEDMRYGWVASELVRNSSAYKISGDALQQSTFVVNVTIDHMRPVVPKLHLDVVQLWGGHENVIYYGVEATDIGRTQGMLLQDGNGHLPDPDVASFLNVAFVDVHMDMTEDDTHPFTQLFGTHEHVLFIDNSWADQNVLFRDEPQTADATRRYKFQFQAHNFLIKDTVFTQHTIDRLTNDPIEGMQLVNVTAG